MPLYLTILPVFVGFVALVIGAIRRDRMFRRNQVKQLKEDVAKVYTIPTGYVEVQTGHLARRAGLSFKGTTMLVAAGTPSLKRLLGELILVDMMGNADMVGGILVYECTNAGIVDFQNKLPSVFRNRVVYASSRNFPNGFGNKSPEWVEGNIALWGVELEDAVAAVTKLHEEVNGEKAGQITAFLSLGGHSFPGLYMVKELHEIMPTAQIVAIVNLPRKMVQRENFLDLKNRYEQAGVEAWLVSDQAEPDWVTVDSTVSSILATLLSAALGSDGSTAINNVFPNASGATFGRKGGMVRFSYHYTDVVAHPFQVDVHGTLRYYVNWKTVESEVLKVVGEIERGGGAPSIDVNVRGQDAHVYDIIAIQLDPDTTRDIRDSVERARDLEDKQLTNKDRPHRHPTMDYETIYTSWSLPIDASAPRCRILVVRLEEIDAPLNVVVAAPADRSKVGNYDGPGEPPPPHPPDPEPVTTSNGVVKDFDLDY
jgi:hypothetical protein